MMDCDSCPFDATVCAISGWISIYLDKEPRSTLVTASTVSLHLADVIYIYLTEVLKYNESALERGKCMTSPLTVGLQLTPKVGGGTTSRDRPPDIQHSRLSGFSVNLNVHCMKPLNPERKIYPSKVNIRNAAISNRNSTPANRCFISHNLLT